MTRATLPPVAARQATELDREALHEMYRAFFAGIATPEYWGVTLEAELVEVDEILAGRLAFVAEEDGEVVGFALARRKEGTRGLLSDIYVVPSRVKIGTQQGLPAQQLTHCMSSERLT